MKRIRRTACGGIIRVAVCLGCALGVSIAAVVNNAVASISLPDIAPTVVQGVTPKKVVRKDIVSDNVERNATSFVRSQQTGGLPLSILLENDQQGVVALSNHDINRVFVSQDKIVRVDAPRGRLVVHNDPSGSLFISMSGSTPVTAFLTTEKGWHVSLLLMPRSVSGVTVRLVPAVTLPTPTVLRHDGPLTLDNVSAEYEKALLDRLTVVVQGRVMPGDMIVTRHELKQRALWHFFSVLPALTSPGKLSSNVVAVTLGSHFATRILSVTNLAQHPIDLRENDFAGEQVSAVAIARHRLLPQASTWVYEVIRYA